MGFQGQKPHARDQKNTFTNTFLADKLLVGDLAVHVLVLGPEEGEGGLAGDVDALVPPHLDVLLRGEAAVPVLVGESEGLGELGLLAVADPVAVVVAGHDFFCALETFRKFSFFVLLFRGTKLSNCVALAVERKLEIFFGLDSVPFAKFAYRI